MPACFFRLTIAHIVVPAATLQTSWYRRHGGGPVSQASSHPCRFSVSLVGTDLPLVRSLASNVVAERLQIFDEAVLLRVGQTGYAARMSVSWVASGQGPHP